MYTSTNSSCFSVHPYVKIDTVLSNILSNLNKTLFHKHVGLVQYMTLCLPAHDLGFLWHACEGWIQTSQVIVLLTAVAVCQLVLAVCLVAQSTSTICQ